MKLHLTRGTSVLFVGRRCALFSENRQKLFALNRMAAYIGCRFEEGIEFDNLAGDLARRGLSGADARRTLLELLSTWTREGLATVATDAAIRKPVDQQAIRVAGLSAVFRFHSHSLAELVRPVFEHLGAAEQRSGPVYDLVPCNGLVLISRDGAGAAAAAPEQVVPVLKGIITERLLREAEYALALHAACLVRDGRALLLVGSPGAGKTTLAASLAARGFRYGGDDIALLDNQGLVHGVPFLPAVKSGAWPLVSATTPGLLREPVHFRSDGKRVRYLALPAETAPEPVRIGWIVMLKRRKGAATEFEELDEVGALSGLLREAKSRSSALQLDALRTLTRASAPARNRSLRYSDSEHASHELSRFCTSQR